MAGTTVPVLCFCWREIFWGLLTGVMLVVVMEDCFMVPVCFWLVVDLLPGPFFVGSTSKMKDFLILLVVDEAIT